MWVVNATPRPLYPRERPCTHCVGGWVGPRSGLDACGKISPTPTGIRSANRPSHSESLYRLTYRGPLLLSFLQAYYSFSNEVFDVIKFRVEVCFWIVTKCCREMCLNGPRVEIILDRGSAEIVALCKGTTVKWSLRNTSVNRKFFTVASKPSH